MSLQEAPSVLSKELSSARAHLKDFNITVNGIVRRGDMVEIKAWHPSRGEVEVYVSLDAATAEYILASVLETYATRLYLFRREPSALARELVAKPMFAKPAAPVMERKCLSCKYTHGPLDPCDICQLYDMWEAKK